MAAHKQSRIRIYVSYWHVVATLFIIAAPFVFLAVFSRWAKIAAGALFFDLFVSVARLAVAYVIAVALAWTFAVLFYSGRRSAVALPVFDVLQSVPVFALLPLAVFFWGSSNFTVVFFLTLAVIWPIFFSVISALHLIKSDWKEAAAFYGLNGFKYLRFFIWPVTAHGLITGSIVGLGEGWEALVATEIITGVRAGLGGFFKIFARNPEVTAFAVLGFLVFIFSVNKLIWLPLLNWSHHKLEE